MAACKTGHGEEASKQEMALWVSAVLPRRLQLSYLPGGGSASSPEVGGGGGYESSKTKPSSATNGRASTVWVAALRA